MLSWSSPQPPSIPTSSWYSPSDPSSLSSKFSTSSPPPPPPRPSSTSRRPFGVHTPPSSPSEEYVAPRTPLVGGKSTTGSRSVRRIRELEESSSEGESKSQRNREDYSSERKSRKDGGGGEYLSGKKGSGGEFSSGRKSQRDREADEHTSRRHSPQRIAEEYPASMPRTPPSVVSMERKLQKDRELENELDDVEDRLRTKDKLVLVTQHENNTLKEEIEQMRCDKSAVEAKWKEREVEFEKRLIDAHLLAEEYQKAATAALNDAKESFSKRLQEREVQIYAQCEHEKRRMEEATDELIRAERTQRAMLDNELKLQRTMAASLEHDIRVLEESKHEVRDLREEMNIKANEYLERLGALEVENDSMKRAVVEANGREARLYRSLHSARQMPAPVPPPPSFIMHHPPSHTAYPSVMSSGIIGPSSNSMVLARPTSAFRTESSFSANVARAKSLLDARDVWGTR